VLTKDHVVEGAQQIRITWCPATCIETFSRARFQRPEPSTSDAGRQVRLDFSHAGSADNTRSTSFMTAATVASAASPRAPF